MRMTNLEIDKLVSAVRDRRYWDEARDAADKRYHQRLEEWKARCTAEGNSEEVQAEMDSIKLDLAFQEALIGLSLKPANYNASGASNSAGGLT